MLFRTEIQNTMRLDVCCCFVAAAPLEGCTKSRCLACKGCSPTAHVPIFEAETSYKQVGCKLDPVKLHAPLKPNLHHPTKYPRRIEHNGISK
eukprot:2530592-Amphidinium_carterae.1